MFPVNSRTNQVLGMLFLLRSGFCIGMVLLALPGEQGQKDAGRQAEAAGVNSSQALAQKAASLCLANPEKCLALAQAGQPGPTAQAPAVRKVRAPVSTLSLADTKPAWRGKLPAH